MSAQLTIDQFFTRLPKRNVESDKNPQKSKQNRPSPAKKRKVVHLPSPPLTAPTRSRPRTPSPIPGPSEILVSQSPNSDSTPFCTPKKQKIASPHKSPFKVPPIPRRVHLDDTEEDIIIPSSQTQTLLYSPTIARYIVPSSQTQLLGELSPQRPKRLILSSPKRPQPKPVQQQLGRTSDEEVVPSSQSLELELYMSQSDAPEPASSQKPAWSQMRSCDEDVFNDPVPITRCMSPRPLTEPDEGSETEPESDSEPGPPTSAPRTPQRVRKWYSETCSQSGSVTSTPKRQRPLGQSVSLNDTTEGLSVPDFVKDMNTMLAGSGSYPDDFPMSLRDI